MIKKLFLICVTTILICGCQSTKYSCPDNYILDDKKCSITEEKEPQKLESCSLEYKLIDGKCVLETIYDATITYSCENNYILKGTTCTYYDSQYVGRQCPTGYSVSTVGSPICIKTDSNAPDIQKCEPGKLCLNIIPSFDYTKCPTGYTHNGFGTCLKEDIKAATKNYKCNVDDILRDGKCVEQKVKDVKSKNYCEEGYTLDLKNNICIKKEVIDAIKKK